MTTPTLSDDRVDAMRAGVMHAVDQDIRRRGRRTRRGIGLGVAGVLVVGFGGYAVSAIDSGTPDIAASTAPAETGAAEDSSAAPQDLAGDDSAGGGTQDFSKDSTDLSADKAPAPDADRQVITTGSIAVTVTKPRQVAQSLSTYVDGIGGRVDSRTEDGTGKQASASLLVRIPSDRLNTAIAKLKTYGTVETVSLQNEDVTATSQDLDARIDALNLSIGRLEKILASADSSRQVISAESALTKRQEQLERLESQKRSLDGQVELSTVEISLAQEVKPRVESVEPGGFTGGLRDGWNGLVSAVNHIVEVAGQALPWAVVLLVVLGAVRLVARRRSWHWN